MPQGVQPNVTIDYDGARPYPNVIVFEPWHVGSCSYFFLAIWTYILWWDFESSKCMLHIDPSAETKDMGATTTAVVAGLGSNKSKDESTATYGSNGEIQKAINSKIPDIHISTAAEKTSHLLESGAKHLGQWLKEAKEDIENDQKKEEEKKTDTATTGATPGAAAAAIAQSPQSDSWVKAVDASVFGAANAEAPGSIAAKVSSKGNAASSHEGNADSVASVETVVSQENQRLLDDDDDVFITKMPPSTSISQWGPATYKDITIIDRGPVRDPERLQAEQSGKSSTQDSTANSEASKREDDATKEAETNAMKETAADATVSIERHHTNLCLLHIYPEYYNEDPELPNKSTWHSLPHSPLFGWLVFQPLQNLYLRKLLFIMFVTSCFSFISAILVWLSQCGVRSRYLSSKKWIYIISTQLNLYVGFVCSILFLKRWGILIQYDVWEEGLMELGVVPWWTIDFIAVGFITQAIIPTCMLIFLCGFIPCLPCCAPVILYMFRRQILQGAPFPMPARRTRSVAEILSSTITFTAETEADIHACNGQSCSICLGEFEQSNEISEAPCKHFFHKECLEKWAQFGGDNCPVCRHSLSSTDDGQYPLLARGSDAARSSATREDLDEGEDGGGGSQPSNSPLRGSSPNANTRSGGAGISGNPETGYRLQDVV